MTLFKTVQRIGSIGYYQNADGSQGRKFCDSLTIRVIESEYDVKGAVKAFASLPIRKLSFGTIKEIAKSFYSEKVTYNETFDRVSKN